MFDEFECLCIYVEFTNPNVSRSGRIEYRAKSCDVCRARESLKRVGSRAIMAFDNQSPRYQRTH